MKNLPYLYEAGNSVKRWHTWPTLQEQSVASHSWGVAMILKYIYPEATSVDMLMALTHDLAEYVTGDIPYPFKKRSPKVQDGVVDAEVDFEYSYGLPAPLPGGMMAKYLKWADMFELLMFSVRETQMGNTKFFDTVRVAKAALEEMGHPTDRARQLYNDFLGIL